MKSFLVRLATFSLALYMTAHLVSGLYFDSLAALVFAAIVLTIVNAIVRPVFMVLTLPFNLMTLGLFTFVVNGLMLKITGFIVPGMDVGGFWVATFAALILTIISSVFNWLVGE